MRILFMHPNMPGQYKHLARIFAQDPANEVVFLTKPKPKVEIPNVKKIEYVVTRQCQPEMHRYLISFEKAIFASQEIWRVCNELKNSGFIPDVIVGHLGWGEGLFLKEIYPDTPILAFMEFFYDGDGQDVGFLQEEESDTSADDKCRIKIRNALHLFNLTYCDWTITPTFFQRDCHPEIFWPKMSVLHDGVDTSDVTPSSGRGLTLPNGINLKKGDEVVTYISRNFEPYRGFPQWMRAAEEILKRRPNCHIIMVGQDGVSYGKTLPNGQTYREIMTEECDIDMDRFHFLGYLPYDQMKLVMKISSAHIYLTVPFVLSWSMLEAMACECLMITSNTAPIKEVIKDGYNGLMVDFFDPIDIANKVDDVFAHPDRMLEIRKNARKTVVERYSLDKVLDLHIELIKDVAKGVIPPPAAKKIEAFNKQTDLFTT